MHYQLRLWVGLAANLTFAFAHHEQASALPPSVQASHQDFRSETIYFVLTSRFFDGDETNNYYNRDNLKVGDPHWRGDFKGLIEQLDYIKDLGFTAIWITPPVENRSGLDYHGYHAYDWQRVDPRLESPGASYADFIAAAHAQGLKVIQDVVINHSSQYGIRDHVWIDRLPIKYYRPNHGTIQHGPYQGHLGDYRSPFREDNDNSVAPEWFRARQWLDAEGQLPLTDPQTGAIVPLAGYNPQRFFGIDPRTLDPTWYHLDGFMNGGDWEDPYSLQRRHMAGDTIDLATENPVVKDYLNNAIHRFLDLGVDAIRIDTAKHIERDNLLEYVDNWRAYKPDLFVFGEALVLGTGLGRELGHDNGPAAIRPWWYTRRGHDPKNPHSGPDSGLSVLDFPLFSTFRDNLLRGNFNGLATHLSWDWIYGDATKLVTFLQNHDLGPDHDFKFRFKEESWKAAVAYNLLWTIRGIPCLYYGEEIEFQKGRPQDIADARMTLDQTGRAYFGDHLVGENQAKTRSHPMFLHIKRLNQLRHAIPALQKGSMSQVHEWGSGMSFIRHDPQSDSLAVIGLAASTPQTMQVHGIRNGTYRDAITGQQIDVNNGTLTFDVKPTSMAVYVLNGTGKIGHNGLYLR